MYLDGRQSQDVLSTVITAKGAAFADKTKEERGEEKPKHMDGYFCRNQPHMLEAPTARRRDGTQFATLVMSQCRVKCCDHSFCNCVAILEKNNRRNFKFVPPGV